MNTTKTTPHVRLTVSDLKEQYVTGKLTVKGYIYNWILASRKCGWKYKTKVKDFCQELGISRAAFYKAIAELKAEPGSKFHFEVPDGAIEMWIDDQSDVTIGAVYDRGHPVYDRGHLPTNVDTLSTIVDTLSTNVDAMSMNVDNKTPKPAPHKDSTALSTSSHLYTTYTHRDEDGLNANNHVMDLRDPESDEPDPDLDPDPTGDPGSDLMMDPDPTGDPRTKFTQPALSQLHKETMGSLGSNSMNGNSLSSRINVKQILEETKRKLMEQVQWQRSQREQRWQRTNVLPVGTQGSYLTPGLSDPNMTTTSTFRSSVKPVMQHLGYGTRPES